MMSSVKNSSDISAANASSPGDETFRHELEAFLSRAAEATTWHVERLLKASDYETTELVQGAPGSVAPGRFIRKRIDASSGAGRIVPCGTPSMRVRARIAFHGSSSSGRPATS